MATGTDATGADAYTEVIAAASGNVTYNWLQAQCATENAIISVDGGDTDLALIQAGAAPVTFDLRSSPIIQKSIQAKNAGAGDDFTALHINVWT